MTYYKSPGACTVSVIRATGIGRTCETKQLVTSFAIYSFP